MLYIGKQYYLINVKLFSLLHTEYHHQELQKENTSLQSIFGIHAVQLKPNSLLFFLRVFFFHWPQAFGITCMYFWKHVRLSNKRSLVCKNSDTFHVRYNFFSLGSVWQILYFIKKNKLPVNIKGNAKRNNPLQDIVLLYLIFAKYIIRIFLLIW